MNLQEDTSLSKVHTLFRMLGLRHLAVIPRANSVLGVITRHDLLPEALEDTLIGQHAPVGAGGWQEALLVACSAAARLFHG